MSRQLATIRRVKEILPIEGADQVEKLTIDGWGVVSRKGEFKKDDRCIFFEVDSFLPIDPRFEFLRKSCYKNMSNIGEGFRIRTSRIRHTLSQGIALPLSLFPEIADLEIGSDCTELLKVQLWEKPIPVQLMGEVKGSFPSFIPRTDEERIQNLVEEVQEWTDIEFVVSEKIDGCSSSFFIDREGEFNACSRNINLKETENNLYWKIARQYDLPNIMKKFPGLALQGEIAGLGIQGNPYKLKGQELFIFGMFDFVKQQYLDYFNFVEIIEKMRETNRDIQSVPIINLSWFLERDKLDSVERILAFAEDKSIVNPNVEREGIVFRSAKNVGDYGKISFKAISNKYLLGEK